MDKCIFCNALLSPGSEEHVFLAALGGRIATRRAICIKCNNAFAADAKVDDALAESFLIARCGLNIWSGRKKPAPTIRNAGVLDDGSPYDFAPGFVPVLRPSKIPPAGAITSSTTMTAKDEVDVKRISDILRDRGEPIQISEMRRVQQRVPRTKLQISIPGPTVYRSIGKTALTAACILYGNEAVREFSDLTLRAASRTGRPDITAFVGWDYINEWPRDLSYLPHGDNAEALTSGFEHSVFICEVKADWIAYVELFGKFRFSVWLGSASGRPAKGIAVNPRAGTGGRMDVRATPPATYQRRGTSSFKDEHEMIQAGIHDALNSIMSVATAEAQEEWFDSLANDLAQKVTQAQNESAVNEVLRAWSEKVAAIHLGERWEETLNSLVIDAVDADSIQHQDPEDGCQSFPQC